MKKPLLLTVILIALIIVSSKIYYKGSSSPHVKIEEEDIAEAIIYDSADNPSKFHTLDQSERTSLVKWFNDCRDIRLNRGFAGRVTIVGINIKMKDCRSMTILNSGNDFEIQVYHPEKNKSVSYWAKQPDIKNLLLTLEKAP
jgi:hypothetical protein